MVKEGDLFLMKIRLKLLADTVEQCLIKKRLLEWHLNDSVAEAQE